MYECADLRKRKYKYKKTWFTHSDLRYHLVNFLDKSKENKILEIGCYEGLTSVFFADNFIDTQNSSLTCVDPFLHIDNNDHSFLLQNGEELNFDYNISNCKNTDRIVIHKITSDKFFENNNNTYTFIYIDGCREPDFIQRDIENSFKFLEKLGILWIDYYEYGDGMNGAGGADGADGADGEGGADGEIKILIDDIIEKYSEQCTVIHKGYQLAIRKYL